MQASCKCFWLCKQVSDYASKLQVFLTMQASFRLCKQVASVWLCKQVSSVSDYASKSQVFLTMQARGRKREEEEGADTRGAGGQAVAQVDINSKTWCLPTSPTGTPKNEERTQTTQTPNIKIHKPPHHACFCLASLPGSQEPRFWSPEYQDIAKTL